MSDPRDWIGKERVDPPGDIVCERGYILHWLEATENANPRFWDADCDVAPPSMLSVWMRPLQFVPGRGETWMPLSLHFDLKEAFELRDGVVAANEMEFHAPVRLGDRITTTQKIRDISDEKTTRVGTGRFWTIDVSYHDQSGELKGVETYEMFSYRRGGSGGGLPRASGTGRSEAEPTREARLPPDLMGKHKTLPQLEIKILARHVVMGASSSRDWQPQHHDTHWAVERVKVKDIFLNTPNQAGWIERYLTDWTGPKGRLEKLRFKMKKSVCAGDLLRFDGTVCAVDDGLVDVDVGLSVGGELATECTARIAVPRFEGDDPWTWN